MATGLTIVVTCADRKSLPVPPGLRFRDVPPGTQVERAQYWRDQLRQGKEKRPLSSLYQGEQWQESLRLVGVARRIGFEPNVVVASAGLGLQPLEASAPAYAATFAMNNADAVATTVKEATAWWHQIRQTSPNLNLGRLGNRVLLVLSRAYALPLADDLEQVGACGSSGVLVGGAHEIPGVFRLPADATLRPALGGTLSSLNQRMAIRFLEASQDASSWLSTAHLERWNSWVLNSQHREVFDRVRRDDGAIKAWIRATHGHKAVSVTRALREYRRQGYACEQARFGRLYREVVTEE